MPRIIDHIECSELSDAAVERHQNELASLNILGTGLDYLFRQVLKGEEEMRRRIPSKIKCFSVGNDPLQDGLPKDLIACAFHWYAVSACNYVRLVGWLRRVNDQSSQDPNRYVELVVPAVKGFRDKVAAHFAVASEDRRDNPAERRASTFPPIGYVDDAFYAHPMTLIVGHGRTTSSSEAISRWSLTKVHRELNERYHFSQLCE